MLRPRSPQSSFYGSYLYDRIIPEGHLTGTSLTMDAHSAPSNAGRIVGWVK